MGIPEKENKLPPRWRILHPMLFHNIQAELTSFLVQSGINKVPFFSIQSRVITGRPATSAFFPDSPATFHNTGRRPTTSGVGESLYLR